MIRFLLAMVLLGSACSSTLGGNLKPDGYHHNLLPIHLRSIGDQATQFVSPDWRLDNFRSYGHGWVQKTGPGYSEEVAVDLREDNSLPESTVERPAFDVLLKHRRTGARMWMRAEILPESYLDRTLESLIAVYAERLSGTAFVGVAITSSSSAAVSRQYATKIVSSGPTKVGDRDAHEAVIEIANLDQLRLDPASRSEVLHVIFVNSGYFVSQSDARGIARGRILVMLGYSAPPATYDQTHDDFAHFLTALQLGPPDRKGYAL